MAAASRGPMAVPALPPTWKVDSRQAEASPRRQAGYPRGFRVKGRGTDADQRRSSQDRGKTADKGEQQYANQGTDHAGGQQIGFRMAVGMEADPGLQQGGGDLESQGDQADLGKSKTITVLEHWIDRGQDGLDQVVDEVGQRTGGQDPRDHRRGAGQGGGGIFARNGWRGRGNGHAGITLIIYVQPLTVASCGIGIQCQLPDVSGNRPHVTRVLDLAGDRSHLPLFSRFL